MTPENEESLRKLGYLKIAPLTSLEIPDSYCELTVVDELETDTSIYSNIRKNITLYVSYFIYLWTCWFQKTKEKK